MLDNVIASYWFGRFQVIDKAQDVWYFRDLLSRSGRELQPSLFKSFSENERQQSIAFFQQGFLKGAVASVFDVTQSFPRTIEDSLFWQFPCRTEAVAWEVHNVIHHPTRMGDELHIYLGLPWATWIDFQRQQSWRGSGRKQMEQQIRLLKVRLSGIRFVLAELGVRLRVHTVCQHIYWQDFVSMWKSLGVTDLWLSHCPQEDPLDNKMSLHPWHLFAVNIEDTQRNDGLLIGRDVAVKPVLASFVGAHMPHYLSDIRMRLKSFVNEEGFVIQVNEKWHFDDVVYQHQMNGKPLQESYQIDDSVAAYNSLLSDSVFSLCPAGAGPNTLRLWESLAVGAIPVLLGDPVRLPTGGNLEAIDWDSVVLRIEDDQLHDLPAILHAMPLEERRQRQQACLAVYAKVKAQRCF